MIVRGYHIGFLALIAVCSCVATVKAGQRRMVEARVEHCVRDSGCKRTEIVRCYKEAEATCHQMGLERTCGEGGPAGVCKP